MDRKDNTKQGKRLKVLILVRFLKKDCMKHRKIKQSGTKGEKFRLSVMMGRIIFDIIFNLHVIQFQYYFG